MKNKGYEINFAAKEITITKAFAKLAQDFTTPEAAAMEMLMAKYPSFTMKYKEIKKKANKESYSGLSLGVMKAFFESRIRMAKTKIEEAEEMTEEMLAEMTKELEKREKEQEAFQNVLEIVGKGKYATIKKWFLDNFKKEYQNWSITEEYNVAA